VRETPKALKAWNDYLAMGAGRSLEKLLERYQSATESAPTHRLMTLKNWSRMFGWQRRLTEIAEQERQAIVQQGIANKQNRVDALDDIHNRMLRLMEARATDLDGEIAAGDTGLLVRSPKLVKVYKAEKQGEGEEESESLFSAKREVMTYEYAFDAALAREIREYQKQAAIEKGEWAEKREVTGADGGPIEIEDVRERLASRLASIAARGGAPEGAGGSDGAGSAGAAE